ncbi:MAG TPA: hypothetical protein VFB66_23960 [Tepidisphaeraceae bacterium]|nr:hypothetical protein [Tepidisphaeraceae bacterium]
MKRRLLNFMTALSVLLCVAVAVLWVRGYWASDLFGYVAVRGDGSRLAGWVCSGRGGLGITFSHLPPGLIQARGPSWRKQAPVSAAPTGPSSPAGGSGSTPRPARNLRPACGTSAPSCRHRSPWRRRRPPWHCPSGGAAGVARPASVPDAATTCGHARTLP